MKYTSFGLFVLVAILAGTFYFRSDHPPHAEKNIFKSDVAAEYFKQQNFFSEHADLMVVNREFIQKMRHEKDPKAIRRMFTGVDLTNSYEKFIYKLIPPFKEGDFFHYLNTSFNALVLNQRFEKSQTTFSNDSYSEGNLPFLQFTLPEKVQTKVIRMGLPMIETPYLQNLFYRPAVNPEFLVLIRSQPRYLYVNLMKRKGLEGPSSHALEALEICEPTFSVVTLDKNSDFYWQKGQSRGSAEDFKDLFYKKMMDPKGAFYWSKDLVHWDIQLKDILKKIHAHDFKNSSNLTLQEKLDFIELSYLEILDQLVRELKPDALNITCKHAIDRGPSLSVLWQFKLGLANESEVAALLLAPPLLMHNRTSHASRLERFISAASFFYPKKSGGDRIQ